MKRYAGNPTAAAALVAPHQVHRDVYINQDVYKLEMKNVFANAWVFVGHESQTSAKGYYFATLVGDQQVIQLCHKADAIHVLYNCCPHKSTKIVINRQGNTGKFFRYAHLA